MRQAGFIGDDAVFGSLKVAVAADPSGSPIASIAMRLAARGQTTLDQVLRATYGLED